MGAGVSNGPDAGPVVRRPPLERMVQIHHAIRAGRYPNATTLAAELEVSVKSIQRDLEFMRDRLALPIAYDARRFGYYYTEEVEAFPTLQITEGEFLALVVAEKALQQYRGTTFEKPLLSAVRKLAQGLPETISLNLADVEQGISFRTRAEPLLDLRLFDTLARAVAHRQQLRITYRKPGQPQAETRVIDPYHLANINGEWYLFAHDHLRGALRTFSPTRMQAVTPTGETFARPEGFSLEKRLRASFGVRSGEGDYLVVLRFSPRVADYIKEKRWHESQHLRPLADGGVELRLRLSGLEEVARWVLSWGGEARVVQPRALVRLVEQAARRLLAGTRRSPARRRPTADSQAPQ